jgi:thiopeptide-type bacteriocin biosynthesis protein
MPADHLTTTSPRQLAANVLSVLAGASLENTATANAMTPADLNDAVQLYQAAGLAALERRAENAWYQVGIQFRQGTNAEVVGATRLGPRLDQLQADGTMAGWWFMRKPPGWRLRMRTADTKAVNYVLHELTAAGAIVRWSPKIYESETVAFGNESGLDTIHDLFCADTRGVLTYLRHEAPNLGRRELSLLLLNGLMGAAGLDMFECGDVFARVNQLRPTPAKADIPKIEQLAEQVRVLLSIPDPATSNLFTPGGPAAHAAPWLAAFQTAGRQLRHAAERGRLDRGIRAILTHVLIFHWNRLGLTAPSQSILANAATITFLPRS